MPAADGVSRHIIRCHKQTPCDDGFVTSCFDCSDCCAACWQRLSIFHSHWEVLYYCAV